MNAWDRELKKVGAAIRGRREQLGVSQERFAQRANIDRSRYGLIERGGANLTLATLFQLAKNLRVDASELIKDVHWADPLEGAGDVDPVQERP